MEQVQYNCVESRGEVDKWDPSRETNTEKTGFVLTAFIPQGNIDELAEFERAGLHQTSF